MAKIVISIPCPSCSTPMVLQSNGTYLCPNPSCKFVKQGDCIAMTPTVSEYIISTLKGE